AVKILTTEGAERATASAKPDAGGVAAGTGAISGGGALAAGATAADVVAGDAGDSPRNRSGRNHNNAPTKARPASAHFATNAAMAFAPLTNCVVESMAPAGTGRLSPRNECV